MIQFAFLGACCKNKSKDYFKNKKKMKEKKWRDKGVGEWEVRNRSSRREVSKEQRDIRREHVCLFSWPAAGGPKGVGAGCDLNLDSQRFNLTKLLF